MHIKKLLVVSLLALCGNQAFSAEINFRGFASFIGGSTLSSDDALLNYDDKLSFSQDSLIALQADAPLDEKLSATVQVLGRGSNGYEPTLEWAYATYRFTDNLQLSAGRIRVPFYRYSDFIDVGYAYNWIKVPQTVYGFDFPGFDGLSMVYSKSLGSWESNLQVTYGQIDGKVNGLDGVLNDITGISWTITRDWLTLRAGYVQAKVTIDIPPFQPLIDAIDTVDAAVPFDLLPLKNSVLISEDDGSFVGLAMGIDYNNFLFDAEYVTDEVENSILGSTDAFYIATGYRIDKWVPWITYSQKKEGIPENVLNNIPPVMHDLPVPEIQEFILTMEEFVTSRKTETELIDIGVRYDFQSSAALKLFWTQMDDGVTPKNQLLRFGIDLVF
jgi:hypothetical protein